MGLCFLYFEGLFLFSICCSLVWVLFFLLCGVDRFFDFFEFWGFSIFGVFVFVSFSEVRGLDFGIRIVGRLRFLSFWVVFFFRVGVFFVFGVLFFRLGFSCGC